LIASASDLQIGHMTFPQPRPLMVPGGVGSVGNHTAETDCVAEYAVRSERSRRPLSLQFAICREIFRNCREKPVHCHEIQ
jgi:hypothetical protein